MEGKDGIKKAAPFVTQLAEAPFRAPDAPNAAYVYLGEGRDQDAKTVMELWNGDKVIDENPFKPDNDLHRVWEVLEYKSAKGDMPVFVDLDGDARTFTPTEFIAKESLASLAERSNQLGDGFQGRGSLLHLA